MAMTLTGFVYDNAGNAISGATVQGYVSADDQTSGTTAEDSVTTDSNGKWSITTSSAARIPMDVKITYGSNVRWIKAGDKVNVTDMTVTGTLTVGEDGGGFDFQLYSDRTGDGILWDADAEVLQLTGADNSTVLDVLDGDVRIVDKLYFYDRDGEYLSSDGSTLTITGATTLSGNVTVTGTIGSGNITSTGTVQGTVVTATTGFAPDASDGAYLGTSSLQFSDLFLADGGVINLGDDQDVTLTHVADTGILLNSSRQLQFGDSGTYIHQSADGVLDLVSDTEIEINATTIDINGAVDISGNATVGGNLTVNGTTTTVDTTNTVVKDSLIELNTGASSNSNDLGVVMERGSTGDNAIIAWDESADGFVVGTTTATGASTGNLTITAAPLVASDITAASLDISGDTDVDGTLEADAYTVDGTALNEYIADTVGAMFTSNTETRITATYQDDDNTIDLVVDDMSSDSDTTYTPGDGLDLSGTEFSVDLKANGGLEIQSTELSVAQGISQYDVAQFGTGVVDTDFLQIDGTSVVGKSAAEVAAAIEGSIDAVGALDGGSITSNFGNINIGSSTFDTTGAVSTGALTAAGVVDITDTTDATDATGDTGALRTEGGASIAKKLYVGTDLDVDGTAELDNITIGGAQGSDGQVLTSTGSGVAWEDAGGGGGTADFVASGSISNGDHVALNSDGTVSVISGASRPVVAFESGSGDQNETRAYSGCFDTTSNKVVVAYIDKQQSNKGYAVVGTIASGAITFGTPVVFSSDYLLESDGATACTFGRYDPSDSATGRVVIAYMNHTADNDAFAIVGTVSGTSISFGTAVEFEDTERAWDFRACWDSDNDRAVIAWIQNSEDSTVANRRGKAIVGTVSGTSITFGTEVVFEDAQTYMGGMCFDSNTNRVVITYVDVGDSSKGKAIVGQVASTGNSISFGTPAEYNSTTTGARRCAFDSNVNKVAIMYDASALYCKSGTVTGGSTNSIAFGSEVRVDYSTTSNSHLGIDFDSNSNKMLITYTADGDGYFSVGTLSGTTSTWTFPALYEEGASAGSGSFFNTPVFDSNSNLFANMYLRDDLHYPQARSRIFDSLVTDNYTFWIGVATAAISDGASGTITVQGGVNESQSGLITGYKYYVSDAAVVSTTYKANREVGIALSATKLLLTQGGVSS